MNEEVSAVDNRGTARIDNRDEWVPAVMLDYLGLLPVWPLLLLSELVELVLLLFLWCFLSFFPLVMSVELLLVPVVLCIPLVPASEPPLEVEPCIPELLLAPEPLVLLPD